VQTKGFLRKEKEEEKKPLHHNQDTNPLSVSRVLSSRPWRPAKFFKSYSIQFFVSGIFIRCIILHSVKRGINLVPALPVYLRAGRKRFYCFKIFGQPRLHFCFHERRLTWQLNRSSRTSYHQICLSFHPLDDGLRKNGLSDIFSNDTRALAQFICKLYDCKVGRVV